MHSFLKQLITTWRRLELPSENAVCLIGVSGGADSLSLTLALEELVRKRKLNVRLICAHFDHGLRPDSRNDVEFVRDLAQKLELELTVGSTDAVNAPNTEEKARDARYSFFAKSADKVDADLVLLAHTLNDQAETFLLNLIRGSGLRGLRAMQEVRKFPQTPDSADVKDSCRLVRPLLKWANREMTEGYCSARDIDYVYDTMNEDDAYKRVRIRKVLLPLLEDFNPKIVDTLASTAFRLGDEYAALQSSLPTVRPETRDGHSLRTAVLGEMPGHLRRIVLRSWLESQIGSLSGITSRHIEAIDRLALSKKSGKLVELPRFRVVEKAGGRLRFADRKVEK